MWPRQPRFDSWCGHVLCCPAVRRPAAEFRVGGRGRASATAKARRTDAWPQLDNMRMAGRHCLRTIADLDRAKFGVTRADAARHLDPNQTQTQTLTPTARPTRTQTNAQIQAEARTQTRTGIRALTQKSTRIQTQTQTQMQMRTQAHTQTRLPIQAQTQSHSE